MVLSVKRRARKSIDRYLSVEPPVWWIYCRGRPGEFFIHSAEVWLAEDGGQTVPWNNLCCLRCPLRTPCH